MRNVIKDLQNYAQFLIGDLKIYFKKFNLHQLLKNAVQMFQR